MLGILLILVVPAVPNGATVGHNLAKSSLSSGVTRLSGPFAPLQSESFFAGVGVFTSDPNVANNSGVNTTITLPSSFAAPAKGCISYSIAEICVFLGVEEPINATLTASVGAVLLVLNGVPMAFPEAMLPNETTVVSIVSVSNALPLGQTYNFSITHSSGTWWDFECSGNLIKGSSAWENGTYNLGQSIASGFGSGTFGGSSVKQGPMQFIDELGNSSFTLPQVSVPWAIGIEKPGQRSPSYRPRSGNAMLWNASYPIGIAGQIQNPILSVDAVYEAGSLPFPGTAAYLWGAGSGPMITSFTASPNPTDVGVPATLMVSALGGTGPLSYIYTGLPTGCATTNSSSFSCKPRVAGTFVIRVSVSDSLGNSTNATLSLKVNVDTTITSFTASRNPVNPGQATYLNVTASGGSTPYTYNYDGLPVGCGTSNTSSLLCVPVTCGAFNVRVYVNDTAAYSTFDTLTLLVCKIVVSSFTASPNPTDVGVATTLTVIASGGTAPYTYTYAGLPGCVSLNTSSLACDPSASGTFMVRVLVNGSSPFLSSTSATLNLTVNPTLSISSFTANPSTIDVGTSTSLAVSASFGATPYAYSYTGLPPSCSTADAPTLSCTPTAHGAYTVRVFVNDSAGQSATATTSLVANAVPSLTLVSITPPSDSLLAGGLANFTATPSCNVGPCPAGTDYTWALTNEDMGTLNASTGISVRFAAGGSPGTVGLFVNATLNGVTQQNSAVITISSNSKWTLTSVTISPVLVGIPFGSTVIFQASAVCSPNPCGSQVVYVWTLNNTLGNLSTVTVNSTAFVAGHKAGAIRLTVTASLDGVVKTANDSFVVEPPHPAPCGCPAIIPFWESPGFVLICIAVFLVTVVAIAIMLRRRGGHATSRLESPLKESPPSPGVSQPPGT